MNKKEERSQTVDKLNSWLKRLEKWNERTVAEETTCRADVEISLLYTDIKEFKHVLTQRSIDEF